MLSNVSVAAAILARQVGQANGIVVLFHIDGDRMGRLRRTRGVLAMPEAARVAIKGIPWWSDASLRAAGRRRPPGPRKLAPRGRRRR